MPVRQDAAEFEAAFAAYQKQDWDAAESALRALNARAPRALYDIYLERIAHFRDGAAPDRLGRRVRLHDQITMKLTVLGCSGGIGSGRHTTSLLVDDDILIDAGSGITTLDFEQLLKIDHVFLTHAHLDHVLGLPLLLDSVGDLRGAPVTVHALPEVLEVLSTHLFNWHLWPDFRDIPSAEAPWLRFEPLGFGEAFTLKGRTFTPLAGQSRGAGVRPAGGHRMQAAWCSAAIPPTATLSSQRSTPSPTCATSSSKPRSKTNWSRSPRRRSITGRIRWRRNCGC